MKHIKYLSKDVIEGYGGRKKRGVIALLVDVRGKEEKIYPMPHEKEHVDFSGELLGKTKRELERNPKLASKLIPSTIEIANGKEVTA